MVARLTRAFIGCSTAVLITASAYGQVAKPSELQIGITTFTSGAASVFGVPGKAAAEL